jgi:hypothetical protein
MYPLPQVVLIMTMQDYKPREVKNIIANTFYVPFSEEVVKLDPSFHKLTAPIEDEN